MSPPPGSEPVGALTAVLLWDGPLPGLGSSKLPRVWVLTMFSFQTWACGDVQL